MPWRSNARTRRRWQCTAKPWTISTKGVAVFSSDGRLRLSNPAYGRIWNLSAEELAEEPHISELVERHHDYFSAATDWPAVRDGMLAFRRTACPATAASSARTAPSSTMPRCRCPTARVLTTWLDVSDSAHVERALRERNEALAAADR